MNRDSLGCCDGLSSDTWKGLAGSRNSRPDRTRRTKMESQPWELGSSQGQQSFPRSPQTPFNTHPHCPNGLVRAVVCKRVLGNVCIFRCHSWEWEGLCTQWVEARAAYYTSYKHRTGSTRNPIGRWGNPGSEQAANALRRVQAGAPVLYLG